MYIHNYLTHLNQNNIENLDISKRFFKIYHMLLLISPFS